MLMFHGSWYSLVPRLKKFGIVLNNRTSERVTEISDNPDTLFASLGKHQNTLLELSIRIHFRAVRRGSEHRHSLKEWSFKHFSSLEVLTIPEYPCFHAKAWREYPPHLKTLQIDRLIDLQYYGVTPENPIHVSNTELQSV